MNISIPSILLSLGGKCLLNWALVFLQRNHICKSLLGVFSVSLAAVDTILTLFVTSLHVLADGYVVLLGLKLTRYHVCLLVQILGQVCNALQWPVVVAAGCDHFFTVTRRLQTVTGRTRLMVCLFVSGLLWYVTVLYVFLLSDFLPVMEDVSHDQIHQCWISHTTQILQVAMVLLLTLGCAALHAGCSARFSPQKIITEQSGAGSRRDAVHQAIRMFLNTWAPVLCLLAVLLVAPVGIPAYLELNAAWLCFLNSLLISVVLCAACPASLITQGLAAVPPDSFCEWRLPIMLGGEDRT